MQNKNPNILKELAKSPWWMGFGVGLIGYVALTYLLPALAHDSSLLPSGSGGLNLVGTIWLLACSGASLLSLFATYLRRRLYDAVGDTKDLAQLSWQQFETFVGEHFRRQGFSVRETGSASGDGGVDLVLHRDGERHVVQCKHWKARKVGVGVVRELVGTVHLTGAERGYLVTFGAVSKEAMRAAREGDISVVSGNEMLASSGNATRTRATSGPFRTWLPKRWLRTNQLLLHGMAATILLLTGVAVLYVTPAYLAATVEDMVAPESRNTTNAPQSVVPRQTEAEPQLQQNRPEGIYRWHDREGNIHYGETPPENAARVVLIRDNIDDQNVVQPYAE